MKSKLLILTVFTCFLSSIAFSQSDSAYVTYLTPDVISVSNKLTLINRSDKTKSITIRPIFNTSDTTFRALQIVMYGVSKCNEHNSLIIMFSDGNHISSNSTGKFNCKGYSFFLFTKNEWIKIRSSHFIAIGITNKYTNERIIVVPTTNKSRYFLQLSNSIN